MIVCNLASGSHGNATLIEAQDTSILIDCGLPVKEIEKRFATIQKKPQSIDAIFVTHEHNDHILGLISFCVKYDVKIFMHQSSYFATSFMFDKVKNNICVFGDNDFFFKSLTISPFKLCHDASACVGFSIYSAGKKVSIATDTGFLSEKSIDSMEGADLVLIESNHDEKMLMFGPYPARLKRRIASEVGHLSNKQCAEAIAKLAKRGTKNFVLCHLSEKNNTQELALSQTLSVLDQLGIVASVDLTFQQKPSKIFIV